MCPVAGETAAKLGGLIRLGETGVALQSANVIVGGFTVATDTHIEVRVRIAIRGRFRPVRLGRRLEIGVMVADGGKTDVAQMDGAVRVRAVCATNVTAKGPHCVLGHGRRYWRTCEGEGYFHFHLPPLLPPPPFPPFPPPFPPLPPLPL